MGDPAVHVFGVRHHGPGCARSLEEALAALAPDVVLVEGPPDADAVIPLAASEHMRPPVALLVYPQGEPQRAAFYPFAEFSPEWRAIRYAVAKGIPVRFMDLPHAMRGAFEEESKARFENENENEKENENENENEKKNEKDEGGSSTSTSTSTSTKEDEDEDECGLACATGPEEAWRDDPLALLAEAAGYEDRELWWERQVEQRRDARGLFAAILEAMTALRDELARERERAGEPSGFPPTGGRRESGPRPRDAREEALREAHMRQVIRAAKKEGRERIAVVCGAWHAPALVDPGPAKPDQELLKGLARRKVEATWIPWTHSRLAFRSGYGAGVEAPGWYAHLFATPDGAAVRWLTEAARLLRDEDLDASSASVIEAARLADALAALRGTAAPGLAELRDAMLAVLCAGEAAPLAVIRARLEVGERLGEVPPETPAVPLQRDLEAEQKRLRLKPSTTEEKTLDLDLRGDVDRARSCLLHRLVLLGIGWGKRGEARGRSTGTFHEVWRLLWRPELAVSLVEASVFGSTIATAAVGKVREVAAKADALPPLASLLDAALLAGLDEAVADVLARVQAHAAVAADVRHLMDALPPLARVARYGDVRGTRADAVEPVLAGLFERALVGLAPGCASLDDDAARGMVESIERAQECVALLDRPAERDAWRAALAGLVGRDAIHGLVRGYAARLLLEARAIDDAELARLAGLSLTHVAPPAQAAAWIEGLLRGSGLVLLHQDGLWVALDAWLAALPEEAFVEMLPLLRRAFSSFAAPERRAMGEKAKKLGKGGATRRGGRAVASAAEDASIDDARARLVLPVLATILGVPLDG